MKTSIVVIGALFATVSISQDAFGFRKFLDQFSEHYDANSIPTQNLSEAQACGICHVRAGGGGTRTPYGEDFRDVALGEGKGFPGIEFIDSDKDGFVNLEEIYLQTAPGKPDSAPSGRIELSLKDDSSLQVTPVGTCAQLELIGFGFQFSENTGNTKLLNVQGSTSIAVKGAKGAILARCETEGLVGSLLK